MKLRNPFPQWVYDLFDRGGFSNSWENLGTSDADCLHHILGRCSNSPYNAAPLHNFRDHLPEGRNMQGYPSISSQQVKRKYLQKTKEYLDKEGYISKPKDLEFLKKNNEYYK